MFFLASKLIWMLIVPSNIVGAAFILAIAAYLFKFKRISKTLIAIAITLYLVIGYSPLAHWTMYGLEERYPAIDLNAANLDPDGVIVLGGMVNPPLSQFRNQVSLTSASERLWTMLELKNKWPDKPIVFTGGSAHLLGKFGSEAEDVKRLIESIGMNTQGIIFEGASRNTHENAILTRQLLEKRFEKTADPQPFSEQKWLLVTSAFHMPRAMAVFKKAGYDVTAYPVDYITAGARDLKRPIFVASQGFGMFEIAIKEYIGLFAYSMSGKL